ncbi:hypothetical protein FIBSPDRAFT_934891 [Athelia psychrophila]|uniref:Uncharacterized protein n=1 Tax=Athelia psychrophila TaxID=1759441 RepID=A0A166ERF1_9AGAM|nr:hypothetical protein FIBSPDRAFT_934891 [Fibularhizoctonia sp. CBS 109695]
MSSPGHIQEKERGRPPISVPELSDMIIDVIHADELGWSAVAVYTAQGTSNATVADEATKLDDPSWFASPERIVDIAKRFTQAKLRARLNSLLPIPERLNVTFIGLAPETLRIARNNMLTKSAADIHVFVIKTLDGAGGCGTRVVSTQEGSRRRSNGSLDYFGIALCMGGTQLGQFPSEKALGRNEITSRSRSPATVPETWPNYGSESARYQGVGAFACLVNSRSGDWVHGVSIAWPAGRGVHVDTWLCRAGYESAMWEQTLAVLALRETSVGNEEGGVKTNRAVVTRVVAHAHGEEGECDMMWLERALRDAVRIGTELLKPRMGGLGLPRQQGPSPRPLGATFHLVLSPPGYKAAADTKQQIHQILGPVDFLCRLAQ